MVGSLRSELSESFVLHHVVFSVEVLDRVTGRLKVGIMSINQNVAKSYRPSGRSTKAVLGVAATLAVIMSGAAVNAATAGAASTNNRIVVSGALSGTLVLGPTTACDIGSTGGQLSAFSTSLSTKKYKNWAVTYQSAKVGANMKFSSGSGTFILQSGLNGWSATSGIFSITATSAKVNLTLSNHEGSASGTVHVKGSWTCKNGIATN